MDIVLKTLQRILLLFRQIWDSVEERGKKRLCTVGDNVRLQPSCKIWSRQSRKSAISVGANSQIYGQILAITNESTVSIGNTCFVGEDSRIWSANTIAIGDRVLISHGVNIHDNNSHSISAALRTKHFQQIVSTGHPAVLEDVASAPIVIEDDVWIGFNSTILKGVTIGRGAIIGASTLVTHDVPAYTIVAGNPARIIGKSRP